MGETSELIRARVQAARNIQQQRFSNNGSSDIICNADMRVGEIRQFCKLQDEGQSLMRAGWVNSICRRERIIVSSNWHEQSQTQQGARRFNQRI